MWRLIGESVNKQGACRQRRNQYFVVSGPKLGWSPTNDFDMAFGPLTGTVVCILLSSGGSVVNFPFLLGFHSLVKS